MCARVFLSFPIFLSFSFGYLSLDVSAYLVMTSSRWIFTVLCMGIVSVIGFIGRPEDNCIWHVETLTPGTVNSNEDRPHKNNSETLDYSRILKSFSSSQVTRSVGGGPDSDRDLLSFP